MFGFFASLVIIIGTIGIYDAIKNRSIHWGYREEVRLDEEPYGFFFLLFVNISVVAFLVWAVVSKYFL